MATTAEPHASQNATRKTETDDQKIERFFEALTGKQYGIHGPLRRTRQSTGGVAGRLNKPYMHQRVCVRRALFGAERRRIVAHDAGLGKTFTSLLFVATKQLTKKNAVQKTLISVPASCIHQWHDEVVNTLTVRPATVLATSCLAKITYDAIKEHNVIIVSKDVIGKAFCGCFTWVRRDQLEEYGVTKSDWARRHGTELHPLFEAAFSVFVVDEAVPRRPPSAHISIVIPFTIYHLPPTNYQFCASTPCDPTMS